MEKIKFNNLIRRFKAIESDYRIREDEVYKSGIFFEGNQRDELIEVLKKFTGYEYAIPTSSGTASLYVMGIYYGKWFSKIITTPYTYIATWNAFKRAGYELTFTNVDETMLGVFDEGGYKDTLCVPVGIYGKQPQYPKSGEVLEDACQNWICSKTTHNKAISFDTTKNISSNGNGGAILTNDKDLWEFANKFIMIDVERSGLNLRMSELECAYIIPQFKNIRENQERRRKIATIFNSLFKDRAVYKGEEDHDLQKYIVKADDLDFKDRFEIRHFYRNTGLGNDLRGIPLYPELTDNEIIYISTTIKEALRNKG